MINYGFFDAVNGDRTYNADDMCKPWDMLVTDGISPNDDLNFKVMPGEGNSVIVKKGKGIFGGKWFILTEDMTLQIDALSSYERTDSIYIRVDNGVDAREISIKVGKGNPPSSYPFLVTPMERGEIVKEYRLATVKVVPGQSCVSSDDITDTRDSECGWISSAIDGLGAITKMKEEIKKDETELSALSSKIEDLKNSLEAANDDITRLKSSLAEVKKGTAEGISPDDGSYFKVGAYYHDTLVVLPGKGIFGGKWFESSERILLTIDKSDPMRSHLYSVILRADSSSGSCRVTIELRTSGYANYPTMENSDTVKEYRLANILVPAGETVRIDSGCIEDTRNSDECGWISAIEPYQIRELAMQDGSSIRDTFNNLGYQGNVLVFDAVNPSDAPASSEDGVWHGTAITTTSESASGMIIIWNSLCSESFISHKSQNGYTDWRQVETA